MVAKAYPQCRIHQRSDDNAQDHSSTECVMLEFLESGTYSADDLFILIQATSPFTKAKHLSEAITQLKDNQLDSLLSATVSKRFFWNNDGSPINYDPSKRPRRQDFDGLLMENGAFYISSVGAILESKNRLSGQIGLYTMPEYTSLELDEPHDWTIAEQLIDITQF